MVKVSRELGFDKMNMTGQGVGVELSNRKAAVRTTRNRNKAGMALQIRSISLESLEIGEICFRLYSYDWRTISFTHTDGSRTCPNIFESCASSYSLGLTQQTINRSRKELLDEDTARSIQPEDLLHIQILVFTFLVLAVDVLRRSPMAPPVFPAKTRTSKMSPSSCGIPRAPNTL